MRCNICDSALSAPNFNSDLNNWEPCHTCLEVISDCLSDFKDKAVFVELDEDVALIADVKIPNNDNYL